MQTIKTAVVVVMLLAVLYGAYVALNGTDTPLPRELEADGRARCEYGYAPPTPKRSWKFERVSTSRDPKHPVGQQPVIGQWFPAPWRDDQQPNSLPQKDGPNAAAGVVGTSKHSSTERGNQPLRTPIFTISGTNLVDTGKPFEPLTPGSPSNTTAMPAAPTLFQTTAATETRTERSPRMLRLPCPPIYRT